VGVKDDFIQRAAALIEAGCDVIVVDVAHGHSTLAIEVLIPFLFHFLSFFLRFVF
jgi:IMP dehydrogenase